MTLAPTRRWRRCPSFGPVIAALVVAALALHPAAVRADVVGIGDIYPHQPNPDPPPAVEVPNLPVSGGPVAGGVVIVGGTGEFIGGTEAGQMTIDIPTDTDPLISDVGAIGYSQGGQGLARVLGLNSEWQISQFLHVGVFGQGSLQISAGARVGPAPNEPITNIMATFVGYAEGSQGFVTVDGFTSLLKSYTLSIGRAGAGNLRVTNGGRIETTFEAQIGGDAFVGNTGVGDPELINGVGLVTLDGQSTRWNVGIPVQTSTGAPPGLPSLPPSTNSQLADLYVGRVGRGTLQIQNQAWARVTRDIIIGDKANSYGEATVTGLGTTMWTQRDLNVGNSIAGANLNIDLDGLVRVDRSVFIGELGFVNMGGGTLLKDPAVGSFVNEGVIRGDGRIDTGIDGVIINNGYIRNGAAVANYRQQLLITGPVVNNDNIESVGGEIEFQGEVINNAGGGDIVGIDAIYRFDDGLVNNGGNIYLKNTLIWTPQSVVTSSANLTVLAGESQLMGDLELTSSSELSIEIGHTSSLLSVIGDATLDGSLIVTGIDDLLGEGAGDGYFPHAGDSFEILTANDVNGTFDDIDDFFPDFDFVADYSDPTRVLLNVIANAFAFNADFNGDGFVDGDDLMTWQAHNGTNVPAGTLGDADHDGDVDDFDLQIWQDQFGAPPPAVAAAGAVPEPTAAVLALAGLALPLLRRRWA